MTASGGAEEAVTTAKQLHTAMPEVAVKKVQKSISIMVLVSAFCASWADAPCTS